MLQVFLPIPAHWNRRLRYWHCYVSWSVSFHGRWLWGTITWIRRKRVRASMRKGSIGGCKRLPSSFYTQFHQPHAHFFIGDIQRIKMCKRRIILYRHIPALIKQRGDICHPFRRGIVYLQRNKICSYFANEGGWKILKKEGKKEIYFSVINLSTSLIKNEIWGYKLSISSLVNSLKSS